MIFSLRRAAQSFKKTRARMNKCPFNCPPTHTCAHNSRQRDMIEAKGVKGKSKSSDQSSFEFSVFSKNNSPFY
jgi:hypothetical protein